MHVLNVLVAASSECKAVGHLCSAVSADAPLRFAGLYDSPEEAAAKAGVLKPDVCVLDLRICGEEGCAWIDRFHACCAAPVVVIDAASGTALSALDAGAADFSLIPSGESESDDRLFAADALERIKAACTRSVKNTQRNMRPKRPIRLLAIACGEGGPAPAAYMLRHLPENAPPVVVVQKKPAGFANDYVGKLSGMCGRSITACNEATRLSPGDIYFAAEESRPEIKMTANGLLLWFAERRAGNGTDAFFGSVANALGEESACVLLAEGNYGLDGLGKVVKKGGQAFKTNKNALLREAGLPTPGGIAELPLEDIAGILSAGL